MTPLGRSEKFIPVDTEAIRPEDVQLARGLGGKTGKFDAIVSADGDSDRPLVSDEHGNWLRGDIAGILCAKFLEADSISTPVSCNTAVEKCGWFREIRRTRIGSPFVVASMMEATAAGAKRVVGYEANGGFLLNSDIEARREKIARPADARCRDCDARHFAAGETAGQNDFRTRGQFARAFHGQRPAEKFCRGKKRGDSGEVQFRLRSGRQSGD